MVLVSRVSHQRPGCHGSASPCGIASLSMSMYYLRPESMSMAVFVEDGLFLRHGTGHVPAVLSICPSPCILAAAILGRRVTGSPLSMCATHLQDGLGTL